MELYLWIPPFTLPLLAAIDLCNNLADCFLIVAFIFLLVISLTKSISWALFAGFILDITSNVSEGLSLLNVSLFFYIVLGWSLDCYYDGWDTIELLVKEGIWEESLIRELLKLLLYLLLCFDEVLSNDWDGFRMCCCCLDTIILEGTKIWLSINLLISNVAGLEFKCFSSLTLS